MGFGPPNLDEGLTPMQVRSVRFFLRVTHPITNRDRRGLTSENKPLINRASLGHHRRLRWSQLRPASNQDRTAVNNIWY
jgi:hypothetical protein